MKLPVELLPSPVKHSNIQGLINQLPIKYNSYDDFWAEEVKIEGLWPLEEVQLFLSNTNEEKLHRVQADVLGELNISLSVLYGLLPKSENYTLSYQRLGLSKQVLVEKKSIKWIWKEQEIIISNLQVNSIYVLSCWNFLLPEENPLEIQILLTKEAKKSITIPLNLPMVIYHIQLKGFQQSPQNLGFWCTSSKYITNEIDDELLLRYWYNILDSESVTDFLSIVHSLNYKFDSQWVEIMIDSLQHNSCYFPLWLNSNSLLEKLQALLKPSTHIISDWYKIELFFSKLSLNGVTIRDFVYSLLLNNQETNLKFGKIKNLILEIVPLETKFRDSNYCYSILVKMAKNNDRTDKNLEILQKTFDFNKLEYYEYFVKIKLINSEDAERELKSLT
ncbi:hypothetical protein [Scytonema sp. NUACC26]|uniref:hypothetical protein n=1 Tax=Scytonema sp. NUACC26 TaxID=3140176 RepID=UPI0034DC52E0